MSYKVCPYCMGTGGSYADSYEDGEIVGQVWIRCINCCGDGAIPEDDE